jgi:hypothetical protein
MSTVKVMLRCIRIKWGGAEIVAKKVEILRGYIYLKICPLPSASVNMGQWIRGMNMAGGGGEGVLVDVILQGWREKKYNIKEMEKKARKVKV